MLTNSVEEAEAGVGEGGREGGRQRGRGEGVGNMLKPKLFGPYFPFLWAFCGWSKKKRKSCCIFEVLDHMTEAGFVNQRKTMISGERERVCVRKRESERERRGKGERGGMQQAELSLLQTDQHKYCRSLAAPFSADVPSLTTRSSAEPTADLSG